MSIDGRNRQNDRDLTIVLAFSTGGFMRLRLLTVALGATLVFGSWSDIARAGQSQAAPDNAAAKADQAKADLDQLKAAARLPDAAASVAAIRRFIAEHP